MISSCTMHLAINLINNLHITKCYVCLGKEHVKLGCAIRMVVDSILPHAECGPNYQIIMADIRHALIRGFFDSFSLLKTCWYIGYYKFIYSKRKVLFLIYFFDFKNISTARNNYVKKVNIGSMNDLLWKKARKTGKNEFFGILNAIIE